MKKLSSTIWPTLKPIIENKIEELKSEIEFQERMLSRSEKNRDETCETNKRAYLNTINDCKFNIINCKLELNELINAELALLIHEKFEIELEPFIPSCEEIQNFENTENDKLYAGRGVIFDESEDLNDN